MKKIDIDECVDLVVDLGILLDVIDEKGEWCSQEARDKCYSLIYEHYEVGKNERI